MWRNDCNSQTNKRSRKRKTTEGRRKLQKFKFYSFYLTDEVTWKCIFWGRRGVKVWKHLWEMGQSSMGMTQAKQVIALCLRVGWGQERRQLLPDQLVVISFIFLGVKYRIMGWGEPSPRSWRSKNAKVGIQKKWGAEKAAYLTSSPKSYVHRIEGRGWRHRWGFFGFMLLWFKKKKQSLNYKHSCYLAAGNSQLAGSEFQNKLPANIPFSLPSLGQGIWANSSKNKQLEFISHVLPSLLPFSLK